MRVHLHVQRFAGLAAAVEGAVGLEIPRIGLPFEAGPCRMAHPQQHARSGVPHTAVPRFEHGPVAIIVDQLHLAAEIIERFGLPVECIDSPAVLRQPEMQVMVVPRIADRPPVRLGNELAHRLGGRHRRSSQLGGEPEGMAEEIFRLIGQVMPRAARAQVHIAGIGTVKECAVLPGYQRGQPRFERRGSIAFVARTPHGQRRMVAETTHRLTGIGHE